jgi:hypothetical protein
VSIVERRVLAVGLDDARVSLLEIVTELEANPATPIALVRDQETAAVVIHPATFEALVDAALDAEDAATAEAALAGEPLTSFADYHARRLARRQAVQR